MQRIIKRSPTVKHDFHLDNGLPSPPIESCTFEDDEVKQKEEMVHPALLEMASPTATLPDSPPSPVVINDTSSEAIREKIRVLKQEKHKLFQTMKDLLSQPKKPSNTTNEVTTASSSSCSSSSSSSSSTTTTSTTITTTITTPTPETRSIERSRSTSRDAYKTRPVMRSRSISHSEFSRPISRYSYHHERRSPPRFYTNKGYTNNRCSFPLQPQSQPTSLSPTSSSLNMSRRNSLYVTSRTPIVSNRPASISSLPFRQPIRPERHPRY